MISDQPPVVLEAWPRVLAHQECAARGIVYRVLPSGAGAGVLGSAPSWDLRRLATLNECRDGSRRSSVAGRVGRAYIGRVVNSPGSDIPNAFTQGMCDRGYDDDVVTAMLGGNWLRHLELADEGRGA